MAWRSGRNVLIGCLVLAAFLVLAATRLAGGASAIRGVGSAIAGPPLEGLAWLRNEGGQRVGGNASQRERIAQLESDLAKARADAGAAAAGKLNEVQSRELASWAPSTGYATAEARVVARPVAAEQVRSLAISAGSDLGARRGLPVMGLEALVGVVDSAGPRVSTVRLLTDRASSLMVRVASTGERGVLRGSDAGANLVLLDPLAAMAVGDLVVTVGTADGAIPPDLPIGQIKAIAGSAVDLSRMAEVTPAVASALDKVVVLVPESTP